jgi:hypothetical protein
MYGSKAAAAKQTGRISARHISVLSESLGFLA